jgi:23S rRNA G2069 N7-methylase RlmK/C1962 C5-methylase RlmI
VSSTLREEEVVVVGLGPVDTRDWESQTDRDGDRVCLACAHRARGALEDNYGVQVALQLPARAMEMIRHRQRRDTETWREGE